MATLKLGNLKGAFARKDKAADGARKFEPMKTTWILDKLRMPESGEDGVLRPVPFIGHLPSRTQVGYLLVTVAVAGVAAVGVAFLSFKRPASTPSGVLPPPKCRCCRSGLRGHPRWPCAAMPRPSRFWKSRTTSSTPIWKVWAPPPYSVSLCAAPVPPSTDSSGMEPVVPPQPGAPDGRYHSQAKEPADYRGQERCRYQRG